MKFRGLLLGGFLVIVAGCSSGPGSAPYAPIDPDHALFWDRQIIESAKLIRIFIDEFNADHGGLPIKIERAGGYSEIFRKVTASIQARKLPAMAVAYESMTVEYIAANAVAPLDPFIASELHGLSTEELEDFFPAVLETNRYAEFSGKMYSFPFAKSVLMLYFNEDLLKAAGIEAPPRTWEAFLDNCRTIRASTGKPAYAVAVDCSTIDGMILSMGGQLVSEGKTCFDSQESRQVFSLLEILAQEDLAFQITPASFEDHIALAKGECAFALRSSSHRSNIQRLMQDHKTQWGIAPLPQANPEAPATVLFGPNICIFNVDPAQQEAAWAFVRYFTSPEMVARWALGTGYLPIRKSVAADPKMQAFWREWKYNRVPFDCLAFAHPEPNLRGWQEVRDLVARAETEVLTKTKDAATAVRDLKAAADAVLARQ